MTTSAAPTREPSWFEDASWLLEEHPGEIPDQSPEKEAKQAEHSQDVNTLGTFQFLLALMLALPQLAWMGFLTYVALRIVS